MTSVVFSRALVGPGWEDLAISGAPDGSYWLDEDGVVEPEFDPRTSFADESPHVAGSLATQSVLSLGSLGLTIYAKADTEGSLKARKRALEAVVRQFTYTAAVTIVGDPDTYTCLPGRISWGAVDSGMVRGLIAKAVLTIPVQPLEI